MLIAQHKREEIERQNEAALRLAKQKQELELEQLQEENRKRLAEAHLVELELQDDISETNEDLHETLSRLSSTSATNENQRINEWINNSPVVTINNNQPQTVVSMGIATSIATTTAVTSSLPPLSNADPTTMTSDGTNQAPTAVGVPTTVVPVTTVGPIAVAQAVTSLIPPEPTVPVPGPSTSAILQQLPILQATSNSSHAPQPSFIPPRMPTFTMPVNHILPNLSAWTFPNPTVNPTPIVTTVSPPTPLTSVTTIPVAQAPVSNVHPIPVTSGGTVYYVPPSTLSTPIAHTTQPTTSLSPTAATFVPTGTTSVLQPSTTGFSIQDLALLLASTKKDHLPEWKLAQYSGDPLQWHEWFGQFKSAIDAAPLTDDVKLTYLKTLVTGKAKTAISEFAYCGAMYRDALKTLERKFTKNTVRSNKMEPETSGCIGTSINSEKPEESSGMPSVTDVKGLLQITSLERCNQERSFARVEVSTIQRRSATMARMVRPIQKRDRCGTTDRRCQANIPENPRNRQSQNCNF